MAQPRAMAAGAPVGGARRRRPLAGKPSTWRGAASILSVLILWEVAARTVVNNPLFFAPLSAVATRAVELWRTNELQIHIWTSAQEFMLGFVLASALGIMTGVVMASWGSIRDFFDPWVSMLYSTPVIALGPLFIPDSPYRCAFHGIAIASQPHRRPR